jgi:two-component system LytT family response regulator
MISALIIDDEENNILNLEALLSAHCPDVTITGTASNADAGRDMILCTNPDLVFLDIQMPKKSGFDLLTSLPAYNFEIIFVTAYDQYGIQAVKFAAIDYLLKPINIDELKLAVKKVIERDNLKKQNLRLENLISIIEKNHKKEKHRIALPSVKETRFIHPEQILRCESSNNYTTFFLSDNEKIVVSKPIYEYEELLKDYGFVRCHQSHLINIKHIKSIVKEDGGYLLMDDLSQIPISQQKREHIKQLLLSI